jgi:nucleoside-diphosphate-sugar epimerase
MRVLVLGGTGFVGPHVVRRLTSAGHDVAVFHRGRTNADLPAGVAAIIGDRAELAAHRDTFARFAPGVVLDMRPLTERDARTAVETFAGLARRLVALSSQDVYRAYGRLIGTEPGPPDPLPLTEDAPLRERLYPYRGSAVAEQLGDQEWIRDYDKILVERAVLGRPDLPGTVLRLPMVYGPGDEQRRLFEYLKRMDDGRPAIPLESGLARWRWTHGYVEDVAHAVALAVDRERAAGRVYNVGEEAAPTQAEWVRRIGAAAGWRGEVVAVDRALLPPALVPHLDTAQDLVSDSGRIRVELGYRETVAPNEALRRTVAWERAHPPAQPDPTHFDYAAEDAALATHQQTGV